MAQKIFLLPSDVINKIAAGEVVENPATIAKELIENSLDAGATQIEIVAEGHGTLMLKIEDNGCGMSQEDALLSIERHATSKIRTEVDLSSLTTMGFRGEALSAIASVSRFEMKTSEGGVGTRIIADGGDVTVIEPCARNQGTTIIVSDLFFNVPARKKFLKNQNLIRTIETIALAHEDVAFSFVSDGKKILELEPQEKKKRILSLLQDLPHEVEGDGIWGLIGSPEGARPTRRGQYVFINDRPIFSPLIAKAVKGGFGFRIDEHSYPSFILFLDVNPLYIDVNVHPQKKEIRFADEKKIFHLVERAVSSAFQPAPAISRTLSFTPAPLSFVENQIPIRPLESQGSFDLSLNFRPLAIVEGFLFLQAEELLLIDLQRAHARVLFESLQEKKGPPQALLWPVVLEFEGDLEELERLGIECRRIGEKQIAIDALPPFLEQDHLSDFLPRRKKLGAACFVKKKFSMDEAVLIWKALGQCRDSIYDPIGRKIWQTIDAEKLTKLVEGT